MTVEFQQGKSVASQGDALSLRFCFRERSYISAIGRSRAVSSDR